MPQHFSGELVQNTNGIDEGNLPQDHKDVIPDNE